MNIFIEKGALTNLKGPIDLVLLITMVNNGSKSQFKFVKKKYQNRQGISENYSFDRKFSNLVSEWCLSNHTIRNRNSLYLLDWLKTTRYELLLNSAFPASTSLLNSKNTSRKMPEKSTYEFTTSFEMIICTFLFLNMFEQLLKVYWY